MTQPLKILFMTSEVAPLAVTGGLADVSAALPRALKESGHDVRIVLPFYGRLPGLPESARRGVCTAHLGGHTAHGGFWETRLPDSEIPLYLVEHDHYFRRGGIYDDGSHEYYDNAERFCFFSQAALDGIAGTGWKPDVVHCHDWPTAPVPIYLKTSLANHPFWRGVPVLFTIHNLGYQGRYSADRMRYTGFSAELFNPECLEYHGDLNLMKGAIIFSDRISTVSPRYAREIQTPEYGAGLDGILRARVRDLSGILNGADYTRWDPATDPHLPANYSAADPSGKAVCKRQFQHLVGLPESDAPLFGIVSRLVWQKGIDLITDSVHLLPEDVAQVAVLGTGDPYYEQQLKALEQQRPDEIRVMLDFNVPVAHQLQAACDFFLMPSRYEPCGLSQYYSLKYGSIPIVRRIGGLADTVRDMSRVNGRRGVADGLAFVPVTPHSLQRRMLEAIDLYHDREAYQAVQKRGMAADYSWGRSCGAYVDLYRLCVKAA